MGSSLDRQLQEFLGNPDNARAFELLEEQLFMAGEWSRLLEVYRARAAAPSLTDQPDERAPVLFRTAQLLEERCQDLDAAQETYWEVARLQPGHRSALRQLRGIHTRRSQWDLVLQIAEIEGQLEMRPYERADFLAEMGRVWLAHLGDPGQALECFDRALAEVDGHQDALAGRARSQAALGHHQEAADAWETLIDLQRGPDRAPSLVALAGLFSNQLGEPDRAAELYKRALTDDPRSGEAVEALSVLASARGQWSLLSDLYERRFDLAAGARRRTAIALEAGNHHLERVEDPQMARMWLQRALELCPDDMTVHRSLAGLERRAGNGDALLAALERVIELSEGPAPVDTLLEAAALHAERGDDTRALERLRVARECQASDPAVLEALSECLRRLGHASELAEVLEERAELTAGDPERQAAAFAELGRLQEEDLADEPAAVAAYARAFELMPDARDVASRLDRLYRKQEDWGGLRRLLERVSSAGPDRQRVEALCSLGDLIVAHFDDGDAARAAYDAALELDDSAPDALVGMARLARDSGDDDALLLAYAREAAATSDRERLRFLSGELVRLLEERDRLEDAHEWAGRWVRACPGEREPIEAAARLEDRLGRVDDRAKSLERLDPLLAGAEQAANRRTLARLQTDPELAAAWYEGALESSPTDRDSLSALAAIYREADRPEDLARIQRRLADRLPDDERAGCLDELSRLLDDRLGDLEGAIVVLWRLVAMPSRPHDAEPRLEALLERAGRFEELAQLLLERQRAGDPDAPEARALELRRAELLLVQLGQVDEATALFRRVLDADPDNAAAADGLERSLRAGNDPRALAELLAERAGAETDPAVRAARELECAILLEEGAGELARAREAYETLADGGREGDGDAAVADEARVRLESLLEREGDWAGLRRRLEARLEETPGFDDAEALALRRRIGALCRDRLADRDAAAAHLEQAVRLAPEDAELWRSLGILYRELDRPEDRVRAIEGELATGPDAERELTLRGTAARLAAESDDAETATHHYERVLELDPTSTEAGEHLVRHYEAADRPAEVVRLLEARIEAAGASMPAADASALRLRIARLRADELDDLDGAIASLEAGGSRPTDEALQAEPLADLYRRAERTTELMTLCRRRAEQSETTDERASWLMRLGDAARGSGDAAGRGNGDAAATDAIDAYRGVLAERPGDREAQAALRELYRERGDAGPLAELLRVQLDPGAGEDTMPVLVELAELLAGPLDRPDEALERYREALTIAPNHALASARALEMAERLERHDDWLALIDRRLEGHLSASERAELLTRRAGLLAGPLDRADEAPAVYRDAIRLEPTRRDAHLGLRQVLERLERWPGVLDCLYVEARECAPEDRAAIYERAAEIAERHLSRDASLPWLERLRAVRPEDAAVVGRVADVHRQAGRPEALLRALEDEIALLDETDALRARHLERARLLENELRSPARARMALDAARAAGGDDAEVLAGLDRIHGQLGRQRDQAEVLEAWLALPDLSPSTEAELRARVAGLWQEPLGEPDRAVPHRLHAVALAGDAGSAAQTALEALQQTLDAAGQREAWARAAEAELASPVDGGTDEARARERAEREVELRQALADVYDGELARPAAARAHRERLLDGALAGFLEEEQRDAVEAALLDRLRAERSSVALEERLARRLERQGDEAPAADWLELARLRDEQLHHVSGAREAYRRVIDRCGDDLVALRGLRRLAERQGDWREVADCLECEVAARPDADDGERAGLWRRAGEIAWRRLTTINRAAGCFERALECVPSDLAAMRALAELRRTTDDWRAELALCERELEVLGDDEPERRRDLWLRIGHLARECGDDASRALEAYESAEAAAPLAANDQCCLALQYRDVGRDERFAEVFAAWCDRDDTEAGAGDHLTLAEALAELGRPKKALARCARARELAGAEEGTMAAAWELSARLHEERGDARSASKAWVKAADRRDAPCAADHLVRAAGLVESESLEDAAALLRDAIECDPAHQDALRALARAALSLEQWSEAERSACAALDLGELERDDRIETALVGARAALAGERLEAAARLLSGVLADDPSHPEALERLGETLFALGDRQGARSALEARLELEPDGADRARHLALVGAGLEDDGDAEAALSCFEEALRIDGGEADAHAGRARVHTCAGRADEAVAALVAWAEALDAPEARAARRLEAARIRDEAGDAEEAETHWRAAVADDPGCADAWRALADRLAADGRDETLLAWVAEALDAKPGLQSATARAHLAALRGRALERTGDASAAEASYADAVEDDPHHVEAALARARLLRAAGRWADADRALAAFVEGHPAPGDAALAGVFLERGRLLAGPLEEVALAIECYERALALRPDLEEAVEPLARLLAHLPDRWPEAMDHHRRLLAREPWRAASLRALIEISEHHGDAGPRAGALALLRSLGVASPSERAEAASDLPFRVGEPAVMSDRVAERLRATVQEAGREIEEALGARSTAAPLESARDAGERRFLETFAEELDRLAAAGLDALDGDDRARLLASVSALALDPSALPRDFEPAARLERAVGRWGRRKLRRQLEGVSADELRAIDAEAWWADLRCLAACAAIDRCGGDLRSALMALALPPEERTPPPEAADLTNWVQGSAAARALLVRVLEAWRASGPGEAR